MSAGCRADLVSSAGWGCPWCKRTCAWTRGVPPAWSDDGPDLPGLPFIHMGSIHLLSAVEASTQAAFSLVRFGDPPEGGGRSFPPSDILESLVRLPDTLQTGSMFRRDRPPE